MTQNKGLLDKVIYYAKAGASDKVKPHLYPCGTVHPNAFANGYTACISGTPDGYMCFVRGT